MIPTPPRGMNYIANQNNFFADMAHDNYPVVVIDGDGENSSDEANGDNGYFEFCHILNVIQDTY